MIEMNWNTAPGACACILAAVLSGWVYYLFIGGRQGRRCRIKDRLNLLAGNL